MEQNWGGSPALLQHRAPHSWCPQGSSPRVPGEPAAAVGGSVGTPTGSAFVWGGPGPAPRCAGWGGQVPLAGSRSPPALLSPPCSCSPSQGLCWGQGWLHPLPCPPHHGCLTPPFWPYVPGVELCLSPHPVAPLAGTHSLWCSRLWIHYCFQTAAKGWPGGVLQSPGHLRTAAPPAWGPPCGPSWCGFGAGQVWPPEHAKLAFACPGARGWGCGHPKTRGTTPNCLGGAGTASWGCGGGRQPEPLQLQERRCNLGSKGCSGAWGAQPVPCDPPRSVSSPPPVFLRVPPPAGEMSPCEVCVSREWVVAAPVNKTAS
ncbi:uncharacterized protein LOC121352460 [Pyrgilauda ruficollis]|uniref:uncharacterized protein LOC121352460 n=1 Tax=Pyrgilauda ruficollis TaxID=221976 RepID=UPI001B861BE1|nr:uncharacterized protein LOC121352460 [Pyrgilauda ruficollis]